MSYLLIKSVHVCAIILWIGGMLLQTLTLRLALEPHLSHKLQRWDLGVTAPAMLIAWMTGLLLAHQGAWFGDRWLTLKLVFVVCLAGLHGVMAGQVRRRMTVRGGCNPPGLNLTVAGVLALMTGVVLLVVVKPF